MATVLICVIEPYLTEQWYWTRILWRNWPSKRLKPANSICPEKLGKILISNGCDPTLHISASIMVGASNSPHGTMKTAKSMSQKLKNKLRHKAGAGVKLTVMKMFWIRGSHRLWWPFSTLGWPEQT